MNEFRVGEVATLRNLAHAPELNGEECTIVLPEAIRSFTNAGNGATYSGLRYIIKTVGGRRGAVSANQLIKKRPPTAEDAAGRQATLQCLKKAMRKSWVSA